MDSQHHRTVAAALALGETDLGWSDSAQALAGPSLETLRRLPKAELHHHLEGSLRPQLLLRLAERHHLNLPFSHPDDFRKLCHYRSFRDFANVLLMGSSCLREPQDFFDAILDMGESMSMDNVHYAEITWTPQLYLNRRHPLDAILSAMNAARSALKYQSGIELRWIPDLVRSFPGPAGLVTSWACSPQAREGGVVALGLGGPEQGHLASGFAAFFRHARALGLPANPHAGEGMGADSVRDTLTHLRPARIGHGVRASEDHNLMADLARIGMPLEVCLTSNVRLGIYPSYAEHPLRQLINAGCCITLNTDDPVLFDTSLTQEYHHAMVACGLDLHAVKAIILAAVRAAYLAPEQKSEMLKAFQRDFDQLDGSSPAPALPLL